MVATWAGSAFVSTVYGNRMPEQVPIHWNINMEPDGFVSRDRTFVIFYLMPTVMAVMLALLAVVLPWLAPVKYKVDPFRPVYDYIIALVVGLFAYLHAVVLMAQLGGIALDKWLMAGFFLFFGLLGNVLGKVRKNFWVGIRTPWTIASDVVWERTHRLAAWLFVAAGILGFVMVMAGVPPMWCFGLLMVVALTPVIYSLVIYKQLERAGKTELMT
jgi:uncharacterized membrane protein